MNNTVPYTEVQAVLNKLAEDTVVDRMRLYAGKLAGVDPDIWKWQITERQAFILLTLADVIDAGDLSLQPDDQEFNPLTGAVKPVSESRSSAILREKMFFNTVFSAVEQCKDPRVKLRVLRSIIGGGFDEDVAHIAAIKLLDIVADSKIYDNDAIHMAESTCLMAERAGRSDPSLAILLLPTIDDIVSPHAVLDSLPPPDHAISQKLLQLPLGVN